MTTRKEQIVQIASIIHENLFYSVAGLSADEVLEKVRKINGETGWTFETGKYYPNRYTRHEGVMLSEEELQDAFRLAQERFNGV